MLNWFKKLWVAFKRLFFPMSMVGAFAFFYSGWIEPEWVQVERLQLTLPHLDSAFDGFRIAQLSDIHVGDLMDEKMFARVIKVVSEQNPDVLVITGDFVSRPEKEKLKVLNAISLISPKIPVLVVFGNHDYWYGMQDIRQTLEDNQAKILINQTYIIKRGNARLCFSGMDDAWSGKPDLESVIDNINNNSCAAILLVHEPDFADQSAKTGRFDLQLSGHTHGGQVSLPGYGGLGSIYLGQKYQRGLYKIGDMFEYTNRGIGTIGFRPYYFPRFNCPPEVTLITLKTFDRK